MEPKDTETAPGLSCPASTEKRGSDEPRDVYGWWLADYRRSALMKKRSKRPPAGCCRLKPPTQFPMLARWKRVINLAFLIPQVARKALGPRPKKHPRCSISNGTPPSAPPYFSSSSKTNTRSHAPKEWIWGCLGGTGSTRCR